ncbi:apolipoprotein N-acyltransferase [Neorhizobium sp. JUb45]|uniref:apolipoprotein N-acyltransferase n=1 Tax=unclassified Neorhizobium TaxID=2629175 RepID=UPI0010452B5A|nr:apolipoprotein N-acyltransferase [Neorhizobium sp. JUb45]TCR02058.1 apolipoprotein N-acyltransferase [Neorhizobium sp. JUb45]
MERLAGKVMLLWGWQRALLAIAAGAIGALALPPVGFFAALFVSFTLLVWLMDGSTAGSEGGFLRRFRATFILGWLFGFGYFVAGLWWLGNALLVDSDEFAWALPLAIFGLPAFLALYYGLATAIAGILWSDGFGRLAALALGFGLGEWLRSFVMTGFPWNTIAYGIMPIPMMMQSAGVVGIFGLSILAVFIFAAPALIGTRKGMVTGLSIASALFAAHLGYGAWRLHGADALMAARPPQEISVRLVQPVIDQARKMDNSDRIAIFEEHLALSAMPPSEGATRPNVIVWPETSLPFILTQNQDALVRISDVLQDGQVLIVGAVRAEDAGPGRPPRYYNSIYAIDSQGQIIGASDKVHLTPFGEYLPYEDFFNSIGIGNVVDMPGGYTAGSRRSLITLPSGTSFYPLICYEAIFPDEITSDIEKASVILNITNDAWFGISPGPYQHFQQARIRAIETGLPLIRDANNGISAVVDPFGRISTGLELDHKGVIDSTVGGGAVSHWNNSSREGHLWLIVAAMFLIALISRLGFKSRVN